MAENATDESNKEFVETHVTTVDEPEVAVDWLDSLPDKVEEE